MQTALLCAMVANLLAKDPLHPWRFIPDYGGLRAEAEKEQDPHAAAEQHKGKWRDFAQAQEEMGATPPAGCLAPRVIRVEVTPVPGQPPIIKPIEDKPSG